MTTSSEPLSTTTTTDPLPSIKLFFRQGTSDKEYHVGIAEADGGYVVNFANGRRGGTLRAGTKTSTPVTLDEAHKIYSKIVKKQTGEGYTPSGEGTPFAMTDKAGEMSGLVPQLLTPIKEGEEERYLRDPDFCLQEKYNGKHVMARIAGGVVTASNKLGLIIPIPLELDQALAAFPDCEVDGELVGTRLWLFDLLSFDGQELRPTGYLFRYGRLEELMSRQPAACVALVETAWTEHGKREFFFRLQAENREGGVFKNIHAASTPGRPASGGSQVKRKFLSTATFKVQAVNQKRSVRLCLLDDNDAVVSVGNCTIPPNKDVPKEGTLIEVEYLYAHIGGSVVQPTYIGERDDVRWEECRTSQLKFKPETEEDEE